MDYKEKYENGLECIQEILSGAGDLIRTSILRKRLQPFFPELQENKDDRIRNGLIKAVSGMLKGNTLYGTDVTREEALAWLEKQGTPKDIDIMSGLKPSDLKPGTWIVHNTLGTCKIVCLNVTIFGSGYVVVSCNDGIPHFIGFDIENDSYRLSDCHLWTINDARDGDVLVNGSNIFIFHYIHGTCLMGYCHINTDTGRFYDDIGRNECFGLIDAPVTPATKEQRNLLFQKMKEDGYEWDAEKVDPNFKVKYAGSEYNVIEIKKIANVIYYGIEDEPNHIDYIKADNCEIINGGYGVKEDGFSFPTKPVMFSEKK